MKTSMIELFLVLFPVGYFSNLIILEKIKVLNYTLDLAKIVRCVVRWIYMACWVSIDDSNDWWSVTPPGMHI